jgi:hypothetical protein
MVLKKPIFYTATHHINTHRITTLDSTHYQSGILDLNWILQINDNHSNIWSNCKLIYWFNQWWAIPKKKVWN